MQELVVDNHGMNKKDHLICNDYGLPVKTHSEIKELEKNLNDEKVFSEIVIYLHDLLLKDKFILYIFSVQFRL